MKILKKEKIEIIKNSNIEIIKKIITILDDFERAFIYFNNDKIKKTTISGIYIIYNKIKKILNNEGLEIIKTNIGDTFNEEEHEIITKLKTNKKELKGKIIKIIEKGYILNKKIIKFTKIIIGI